VNYTAIRTETGATYTALGSDNVILMNIASSTVTLPTTGLAVGKEYTIKKTNSGAGTITVTSAGNIDGLASNTSITAQYQSLTVVWDGSTYWII